MSVRLLALRSLAYARVPGRPLGSLSTYLRAEQAFAITSHYRQVSRTSIRLKEESQTPLGTPLGKVEPKLSLTFTCAVTDCGHRSSHEFSRRSYEKGIVIVQCPSCKNRHLIADHLSWFTETDSDPKNIEQLIASKGGKVSRGVNYVDGQGYETMEIYKEDA